MQFGADALNSFKPPVDPQQECARLSFLLLTV